MKTIQIFAINLGLLTSPLLAIKFTVQNKTNQPINVFAKKWNCFIYKRQQGERNVCKWIGINPGQSAVLDSKDKSKVIVHQNKNPKLRFEGTRRATNGTTFVFPLPRDFKSTTKGVKLPAMVTPKPATATKKPLGPGRQRPMTPAPPAPPLRPTPPPAPPVRPTKPKPVTKPKPKPRPTKPASLLEEIKKGKKLKPVSPAELEEIKKRREEARKSGIQTTLEKGFGNIRLPEQPEKEEEKEEEEELTGEWAIEENN